MRCADIPGVGTILVPPIQSKEDKTKAGIRRTDKKIKVSVKLPETETVLADLKAAKDGNTDPMKCTWKVQSATPEQAAMGVRKCTGIIT
eukprot:SAG31_NODE_2643_length_5320_cov_13.447998_3_plen_89_part_00